MTLRVPTFVVISGAEIGAYYVRQLLRATAAGRLETERIFVLDHDPACAAAARDGGRDPRVLMQVAEWSDWLDAHLDDLGPDDHLVPYHWAPHLLVGWLERQAVRAGAEVARGGPVPPQGVPYERPTSEGSVALSYATWVCPPTCIEPALCPHTRGPKDWSLIRDLETGDRTDPRGAPDGRATSPPDRDSLPGVRNLGDVPDRGREAQAAEGRRVEMIETHLVFRCLHLVYGVGTIPVAAIHAARDRVLGGLGAGPRRYLVATSSHCHALATSLEVIPRAERPGASQGN